MALDPRVGDLVSAWHKANAAGRRVPVEEVCREAPELVPVVAAAVAAAGQVNALLSSDETALAGDAWNAPGDETAEIPAGLPRTVGEYQVVHRLGRGGMGEVFAADDPRLGRRVAVKVMRAEVAGRPGFRERFLREARAVAAVEHDHVVPVWHVGEDGGTPYIVMPLLAGETLDDRLKRESTLSPTLAARVGAEVCRGLAAAHSKGLIHRDVKPANVWLEADESGAMKRARVLDFGLARPVEGVELTAAGGVLGTPGYMAPEQAAGKPVDARADLFAVGATLYRAVTGTPPFVGGSVYEVLTAVATTHPPPASRVNPAVPGALSELIDRLLTKDPAHRPENAAAVADMLNAIAAGQLARVTPRLRRRWQFVAGGVTLVGLVVVILLTLNTCQPVVPTPSSVVASPTDPVPLPPFRGSVDPLIYRTDFNRADVLVPLSDPLALPLRTGDQLKIVAEINRPAYLYVFWIDETGSAVPLYPWEPMKWGTRPAEEKPTARLDLKAANGNGFKISGDADGMETVLMLARNTKLEATDDEVKGWFAGLKPLPFRGEQARVWFEDFEVLRADAKRALQIAGDADADDGPRGLMQAIKRKVNGVEFSRAISFARIGPIK